MNHCTVIGIDTAKHSFALHGADGNGGSHYWGRAIRALGHAGGYLSPIFVVSVACLKRNLTMNCS